MSAKTIYARIGALALIGGLAACGTASVPLPPLKFRFQTVFRNAIAIVVITNGTVLITWPCEFRMDRRHEVRPGRHATGRVKSERTMALDG
jgi:hypothetical protein